MRTRTASSRRALQPKQRPTRGVSLMRQRMLAHDLDPDWFCLSEPAVFDKLRSICGTCKKRKRCAADLADDSFDPARPGWHDYCPNAAMFNLYSAIVNYYWRATPGQARISPAVPAGAGRAGLKHFSH